MKINPAQLNRKGFIQKNTPTKIDGMLVDNWLTVYDNVYMKLMPPMRGSETTQQDQTVAQQRYTFLLWSLYIEPGTYRVVLSDQLYQIEAERAYQNDLYLMLVDTVKMDNEPRVETGPDDMAVQGPEGELTEKI